MQHVCVYCSSSNQIDDRYKDAARELGRLLAQREHTLVYGGGRVGLMGELARAVHEADGRVVGVIPEALKQVEGVAYDVADEMIVTFTMQERKNHMFTRADAFIVLPGGFGTLEELLEVLTLRQLGYHDKPIVLVNTNGFFDRLLEVFEQFYEEKFAHPDRARSFHVAEGPGEAIAFLESYTPTR